MSRVPWLSGNAAFPPIDTAMAEPNGLLAAGGDLKPARLVAAYEHGIFPWSTADEPLLWWSPDPRMVLYVDEFKLRRSLVKTIRGERYEIRVDSAFADVMLGCAMTPRRGQLGTWITPAMIDAYVALHRRGLAHSVEAWHEDQLVGGLYGVAIGRMFFGESMYAQATDASKVALAHLVAILRKNGFPMIDCQQETAHLASFGARPIRRAAFAKELHALVHCPASEACWAPLPVSDVLP